MEIYRVWIYKSDQKVDTLLLLARSPYAAANQAHRMRPCEDDEFASVMVIPMDATFQPTVTWATRS